MAYMSFLRKERTLTASIGLCELELILETTSFHLGLSSISLMRIRIGAFFVRISVGASSTKIMIHFLKNGT